MIIKKLSIFIFIFVLFFSFISFVYSDSTYVDPGTVKIENPIKDVGDNPAELIGNVINTIFGIVGSLALLMFIYGGLTWMTSSGSQEAVKKGKNVITWAAIGLAVIFTSYALVRFVIMGIGA